MPKRILWARLLTKTPFHGVNRRCRSRAGTKRYAPFHQAVVNVLDGFLGAV